MIPLDSPEATTIADILDPEATGPMHGRYVPVGSPRGKELLARRAEEAEREAEEAFMKRHPGVL